MGCRHDFWSRIHLSANNQVGLGGMIMDMKSLPEAAVYEAGLIYWPYKASQQLVLGKIAVLIGQGACLVDIMCGPGNLLGKISRDRPDLKLVGVDIDQRYVQYGRGAYPKASFLEGDVLHWQPSFLVDAVVCTGALHHVPYSLQEEAIANIASLIGERGLVILADCYIDDYRTEVERRLAAAKLGYEYLRVTIENGASEDILAWTVEILWNDVFWKEYKTSVVKRLPLLEKHFRQVETIKAWPLETDGGYGDYVHICYR